MDKKNIFLNNPIGSDNEDIFGVKIYVDSVKQSIENGAKTIAVTSTFGGGKSSVFKLLEEQYDKESNYKFISINMWNQISRNSHDSLRKNFLYYLSSSLNHDDTYITKILSKNYGVLDLSFDFSFCEKFVIGIICVGFVLINWYKDLIYKIFQILNVERYIVDTLIFIFLVVSICVIIFKFTTRLNIAFSSRNSENNRELEEIDYFRLFRQIIEKASENNIIIALEDMDRTNDYVSIIAFISEIKKFSDSYHGKKNLVVIIAIKSEIELLKAISDIESLSDKETKIEMSYIQKKYNIYYDKYFDYTISIPKVNTIDYYIVLSNLLEKSSSVQSFCKINNIENDKLNIAFQWLARGRNLTIRKLKERINDTFLLYESIKENNPEKTVDINKCAVSTYLNSEYPLILFLLKDDGLDKIISKFISTKKLSTQILDDVIDDDTLQEAEKQLFIDELQKLITNGFIDLSYRFYFYNTPKNTEFLDIEETYVSELILHDKNLEKIDNDKIKNVGDAVIIKAISKYNSLGIGFPKNIYQSTRLFMLTYKQFSASFKKDLYRYIATDGNSLTTEQISIIIPDINDLVSRWKITEDKEGILELRKVLLREFEENFVCFENIFKYNNALIELDEMEYVHSVKCLYYLINFDSNKINLDFYKNLNRRIQEIIDTDMNFDIDLINEIYTQIYIIINNKEILIDYCSLLKKLKILPDQFNVFLIDNIDVFKEISQEYADIVNELEKLSIDKSTYELINLSKEKIILHKNIIDEIYALDIMYYIQLMLYNNNFFDINYSNELIQRTLEDNIKLFSNDAIKKIRECVVSKDISWFFLFKVPNDFITYDEILKSKDLQSSFKYIDKERILENYQVIYKYFYSIEQNKKNIKLIYDYIFSIDSMESVYKLLLNISFEKIPFGSLKKSDQNTKLNQLCNGLDLSNYEKLKLLECLNVLNTNIEKNFTVDDMELNDFETKYVKLIKSSDKENITKTTISNIKKMIYLHVYDEKIEKHLIDNKLYIQYLYSKTKRKDYFEFPFSPENLSLKVFCLDVFNADDSYDWLRKYMLNNEEFMNVVIEQQKYTNISKENAQEMFKFRQDKSLLIYIVNKLDKNQLLEYFSTIVAFKDEEAMIYAVGYVIENNFCSNERVYKNLHNIAIDPKYKGKLTRNFNKINNK